VFKVRVIFILYSFTKSLFDILEKLKIFRFCFTTFDYIRTLRLI